MKTLKTLPEKFDALFALTHALFVDDKWMSDNECWGEGGNLELAIKQLSKAWVKLLAHSDTELDIDPEFTRPGIESLLEQFAKKIEHTGCIEFAFNWLEPTIVTPGAH